MISIHDTIILEKELTMTIKQTIMEDMKAAMKAHDSLKLNTVRLFLSELKNFEIDNGEQDDAGAQKIAARLIKQWQDALKDFEKGGREDLITETKAKMDIISVYLPKQLDDAALATIVDEVIAASPVKTIGPITGQVMKRVAGQADGGRVSAMVQAKLAAS